MALKDWGKKEFGSSGQLVYKKDDKHIYIILTHDKDWYVSADRDYFKHISFNDKTFKTKAQAMTYAKNYMRSH